MKAGKWFIIIGLVLIIIGLMLYFLPSLFRWFGHLPGDIRIEKGNTRIYFPLTSMIVISLVITVIINLFRFFKS
ncbi:MAG TPA: DUF2905 domain-containing protein [Bacteroidales bacterium]|nr:DUF2905 domain-containing protein [Bacteroidales bacterium]MDI9574437.1 DUF2905 domain-containing protein [Bacteroidota bacterium]MBP9511726.1 DUF2905 domain-containing protein [Bacteroidales bacterium]MBP9588734.1 DUF2905 domain-containing protein [Bacteroidales bacterium]NMD16607.1 DUF2905 domain-containing protein [Bacteroidales bacterium]